MLIASLVLSLASLLPAAPPPPGGQPYVYPCAVPNPDVLYVPFEGEGECYLLYHMGITADKFAYYTWIADNCQGGDCACYAEAWARFLANVSIHEDELIDCILFNPSGG